MKGSTTNVHIPQQTYSHTYMYKIFNLARHELHAVHKRLVLMSINTKKPTILNFWKYLKAGVLSSVQIS